MRLRTDTRGVSVTVTHAIALGITAILMTGLVFSAGSMLEQRKEQAAREQLQDISGNFAGDLTHLDNIGAGDTSGSTASLYVKLPESVSGMDYTVTVKADNVAGPSGISGDNEVVLYFNTTSSPAVSIPVVVGNETWVKINDVPSKPERIQTDEFRMRLCYEPSPSPSSPYPDSGASRGQLIVFGEVCP